MCRVSSTTFVSTPTGFRHALHLEEERQQALVPDVDLCCPTCGRKAVLKDSRAIYGTHRGFIWACPNYPACDSYVGCHRNSSKPLGTLANANLRRARVRAHKVFDTLWKSGKMTRKAAYSLLQDKLSLTEREAHIAKFSLAQCYKVFQIFKEHQYE